MRNTEMNPTTTRVAVLFWAALAALTFVLLLLGYSTHFWR
jgi:sensor domain CHASE-containing protein